MGTRRTERVECAHRQSSAVPFEEEQERKGVKVAHWGSWGFWGLEKSSKVMRKSRDDDSFFCFRVSKGIERVTLEKKSRDLNAISALSRTISARSGDR